jgi:TonB family protein
VESFPVSRACKIELSCVTIYVSLKFTAMKNSAALTFSILLFSYLTFAQNAETFKTYLDENCFTVQDSAQATYYRTIEKTDKGFVVRDYYMTGELEMMAMCSSIEPNLLMHGTCINYYKNGKVREEGNYEAGSKHGLVKRYHENGQPRSEVRYVEMNKQIHYQHWSPTGEPLLQNGNGHLTDDGIIKGAISYIEIKDSVLVNSFHIDKVTADTIYNMLENIPEYPGGLENLMRDIRANMIYPKYARKHDIEGTVYIQFLLDKSGKVVQPQVLRGIHEECDAEAMAAVSKLKRWSPGTVRGKPVYVRFVLPVKFKLN